MSLPLYIQFMKAYGGSKEIAEPYFSDDRYLGQEKLDGVRAAVHKDEKGLVRVYTRTVSKKTGVNVDDSAKVPHLIEEASRYLPNGTILDGEICAPEINTNSNKVTHLIGGTPENSIETQTREGFVRFRAFDILYLRGVDLQQEQFIDRDSCLRTVLRSSHFRHIHTIPLVEGESAKRALYEEVVAAKREGIIMKLNSSPYEQGARPRHSWIKRKKKARFDLIIVGVELAEEFTVKKGQTKPTRSRIAGLPGSIRFGQYVQVDHGGIFESEWSGYELKELGSLSGFNDETRLDLAKNWEKYVKEQRVFEAEAVQQYKTGALQHGEFVGWRADKCAKECIYRPEEG